MRGFSRSSLLALLFVWPVVVMGFVPRLPIKDPTSRLQRFASNDIQSSTSDAFIVSQFSSSECDDINTPPSLSILLRSLSRLPSGSDIRGKFVNHKRVGSLANVAYAIGKAESQSGQAPLTPLAAHCLGYAFATKLLRKNPNSEKELVIAIGHDPRTHSVRLCDAFARGAQSVAGVRVVYTGLATTPAMFEFCRSDLCDGAAMVTASHLPSDRNGIKFFTKDGGYSKSDVLQLTVLAMDHVRSWHDTGVLPPSSGEEGVFCSEWVEFMPQYAAKLKNAIVSEVTRGLTDSEKSSVSLPLAGLRIVLNAGNGSGGFFNQVLQDLGADVTFSMHLEPNGDFPAGVPNPENAEMIKETTRVCEESNADLGVMLDTDADRCGFVVPRKVSADGKCSEYEPLNRNRLIALLATIFSTSSPGCTIVTCSVTSEGLSKFLEDDLGLNHVRYLKGYANVIGKARQLTESGEANAEVAIETSGHCAMKENGYLDDGTYTAVKIISVLAMSARSAENKDGRASLLDLISNMEEMPVEEELRMKVLDESLETTSTAFDYAALGIEEMCDSSSNNWSLDVDNLEGIRVRTGKGGFFMLRKSLHDPLISLQVEGTTEEEVRSNVVQPLLETFKSIPQVDSGMDLSVLEKY